MSRIPDTVLRGAEAALEEHLGRPVALTDAGSVGGGCINPSARVETDEGDLFFLKWNETDLFTAEAEGLRAIRDAAGDDGLRVPEVVGVGAGARGGGAGGGGAGGGGAGGGDAGGNGREAWLLLEFVPEGRPAPGYGSRLGQGLAELHRAADERYGWERPNWIGSLPQSNARSDDWTAFWRSERLEPQLASARERGFFTAGDGDVLDRLLDRLDDVLAGAGADGPSLLHGDLWGGNVYPGPAGEPVIIDPAVYYGHREVDLAMSELFGGFPPGFRRAYDATWPVDDAYDRVRRDVYQLYYLLVHVNLFGGSYVAGSLEAARRALAAA